MIDILVVTRHGEFNNSYFLFQGVLFGISYYLQKQKHEARQFKQQHPAMVFCLIVIMAYYLIYKLGSILVFLFGVILPICFIVIHASLRLRNMKNKLANVTEKLGIKSTPMGLILTEVGIETDYLKSL